MKNSSLFIICCGALLVEPVVADSHETGDGVQQRMQPSYPPAAYQMPDQQYQQRPSYYPTNSYDFAPWPRQAFNGFPSFSQPQMPGFGNQYPSYGGYGYPSNGYAPPGYRMPPQGYYQQYPGGMYGQPQGYQYPPTEQQNIPGKVHAFGSGQPQPGAFRGHRYHENAQWLDPIRTEDLQSSSM